MRLFGPALLLCGSSALAACQCLTHSDASYLVNGFINHVGTNFNATIANELIADGANVTSQSFNALAGKNGTALQGVTYEGKQAIINGEGNKAGSLSIRLLAIDVVGCDSIGWRWWGIPNNGTPVRAISIFQAVHGGNNGTADGAAHGWQIKNIYGEFNSITWGEDIGAHVTLPAPPPPN